MNKKSNLLFPAAIAVIMLSASSCTQAPSSVGSEPSSSPAGVLDADLSECLDESLSEPPDEALQPDSPQSVSPQEEYISLVESYVDDAVFQAADESDIKKLSDKLQGHYEITGRTDGNGLEYYIAVRRGDAPVYDDYGSLNVGELDAQLYVGYYDKNSDPVVLYELDGYSFLDMPLGYDKGLDCFCFGRYESSAAAENPAFIHAFNQNGRDMLNFMKSKPELSFYKEGQPYVQFYYQDEDTIKFYSEPYPCYITLTAKEQEYLRRHLISSKVENGVGTIQEARDFMQKKGGKKESIRSTGVSLLLDGLRYQSFENSELPGYLVVSDEENGGLLSLEYNEEICRFLREKVKDATGMDYGYCDSHWFKTPLKSASIVFPEYKGINGTETTEVRTQTVEDRDKLDTLAELMDRALNSGEFYGFSACPYNAIIDFIREDGETLRVFAATDSCDSMAYEGRIGFEYGRQADLAAVFDAAMVYRLEK